VRGNFEIPYNKLVPSPRPTSWVPRSPLGESNILASKSDSYLNPSPLRGEGPGEGEFSKTNTPQPLPSPTRGEGNKAF